MSVYIAPTELLRRAAESDSEAVAQLLRELEPHLRHRFEPEMPRRLASVLDLDDLLQETFTDVFLDIADFCPREPESFDRWVTLIARNNLRNVIRNLTAQKRGGNHVRQSAVGTDDSYTSLLYMLSGTGSSPSKAVTDQEAKAALEAVLNQLPEVYQVVVRAIDLEDRPVAEVAEALGRREGAVFMLRARAHRMMRDLLLSGGRSPSDFA